MPRKRSAGSRHRAVQPCGSPRSRSSAPRLRPLAWRPSRRPDFALETRCRASTDHRLCKPRARHRGAAADSQPEMPVRYSQPAPVSPCGRCLSLRLQELQMEHLLWSRQMGGALRTSPRATHWLRPGYERDIKLNN